MKRERIEQELIELHTRLQTGIREIGINESARRLNCDPSYMSRIADGTASLTTDKMLELARRLGIK